MRTVTLATLVLCLSACDAGSQDSSVDSDVAITDSDTVAPAPVTEAMTDGGTYHVRYTPTPAPIPLNAYFALRVEAFTDDAMTAPATGVTATFDAGMPAHGHGMNVEPVVTDNGDGTWDVDGVLFHMEGDWQVIVGLEGPAGLENAVFDVACCE